jgi:HAD superfamily hydrolase (TIGR01549 family)
MMKSGDFRTYLEEHKKREVIFDFDETISTLLADWTDRDKAVVQLFQKYDPLFPSRKIRAADENAFTKRFGAALRDELLTTTYEYEQRLVTGHRANSVALTLIQKAQPVANLHIWTSNYEPTVRPILKELCLEDSFKRIITRNHVMFLKPHPDGFYLIFDQATPKSAYLLIGDSENDRYAAENAGIDFLNIGSFT